MIDGIKILNLSVTAESLLQNNRLKFALPIDESTGAVLNQPRRSTDRGMTFTIGQWNGKIHCELVGSPHKYRNGGMHNADDFNAADLVMIINELVTVFAINPFSSRLNNVEFGVNIKLPFPVREVLNVLICYKAKPFVPGKHGKIYYQCETKQFILKIYDKGRQYGLSENLLRFEVKVVKMEFLAKNGIQLKTLADLLNTNNYPLLGKLLLFYFNGILFDDPSINLPDLSSKEQNLLMNGRNPRYWVMPDPPVYGNDYERVAKRRQRDQLKFRTLLDKYRRGGAWQSQAGGEIKKKWEELTVITPDLADIISNQLSQWRHQFTPANKAVKCPEITGVSNTEPAPIDA